MYVIVPLNQIDSVILHLLVEFTPHVVGMIIVKKLLIVIY